MELKGELTPLESRLVEFAAAGDELDCAPIRATITEFDQINDWEERKIRAEILVALCTGEVSDWSVHPRQGIRLRGAYIAGHVDLSRAQLTQCPLAFHTCYFEEDVVLDQATTTDLSFTSCALPSLSGARLDSSGSLHLIKTHLREMAFDSASLRGIVGLSEVRLINPDGYALGADSMSASDVFLEDVHVEGEVRLLGADLSGQLSCKKGTKLINPGGRALNADSMSASGVFLGDTHVKGEIRLLGADLSGQLACGEGAKLINPEGYALNADSMSASSVVLEDVHVKGEIRLLGADLSGQLACGEGAKLINPEGYALNADGMSARSVVLEDVHVEGEVRLVSADLSGQLACRKGTKLINLGGRALSADGMSARSVFLHDSYIEGEVRLLGADLSNQLSCDEDTKLINPGGYAFNVEACQVGGALSFRLGEAAVGVVNVAYAQIGTLVDNLASWPETYILVGFSYNSLGTDESLDRRLRWISNSKPFSPHVYSQLAEVYRRSGHEGFARKVAIRREEERGRQPDLSLWSRAWNRFLGFTVAYGYRPWQAGVYLVVLFILGWILFTLPPAQEVMVHRSAKKGDLVSAAACHAPYPCFSPPIYVLDTLLPIVDLHQESYWVPARPRPWGVLCEWVTWVLIASGWILTTAVVAGIGSLWRRE